MNYEKLGNLNSGLGLTGCFIAGGAVLSRVTKQPIADYDVYPKTREDMFCIFADLLQDGYVVNLSEKAATFKLNDTYDDSGKRIIVQVVIGEFTSPKDIFDLFDFTVCMGAYDVDTDQYVFDDRFWIDVAAKNLNFNPNTRYPLNSMLRVNKYRAKGYHISKPQMTKMALTCIMTNFPESWEDLETQIGGTYGRQIKINSTGLDFTKDNIFKVLDSIVEFRDIETDDFSKYKEAELEFYYSDDKSNFKLLELTPNTGQYSYYSSSKYFVVRGIGDNVYEIYDIKVDLLDLDIPKLSDGFIKGYKTLIEKDGVFYPGTRGTNSKVTYVPGEAVSINPADYNGYGLYMSPKINRPLKGKRLFEAMVPVKDVIGINSMELVSKTIYIGKEVT